MCGASWPEVGPPLERKLGPTSCSGREAGSKVCTTRKHYWLLLLCCRRCFDARAADLVNMGAAFLPAWPGGAWHQDEVEQHKTRPINICYSQVRFIPVMTQICQNEVPFMIEMGVFWDS